MPTYEYLCGRCGELEVFQRITEEPLIACPECGSKRFQRQISGGAGIIFRGSGFWETDYNRSEDYKKQSKAEAGSTAGTGSTAQAGAGDKASASTPASGESAASADQAPASEKKMKKTTTKSEGASD